MVALNTPAYCSDADLDLRFGDEAIENWSDHDDSGTVDSDVVNTAINRAKAEMDLYLLQRYDEADLANLTIVNAWCVELAGYYLATTRGNPAPDDLMSSVELIFNKLSMIAGRGMDLQGIGESQDRRPVMSNRRITRQQGIQVKIRRGESTGPVESQIPRKFDADDL